MLLRSFMLTLVNDECGSWYNRVVDFLLLVWEERKKFYVVVDQKWDQFNHPHSRVGMVEALIMDG